MKCARSYPNDAALGAGQQGNRVAGGSVLSGPSGYRFALIFLATFGTGPDFVPRAEGSKRPARWFRGCSPESEGTASGTLFARSALGRGKAALKIAYSRLKGINLLRKLLDALPGRNLLQEFDDVRY